MGGSTNSSLFFWIIGYPNKKTWGKEATCFYYTAIEKEHGTQIINQDYGDLRKMKIILRTYQQTFGAYPTCHKWRFPS